MTVKKRGATRLMSDRNVLIFYSLCPNPDLPKHWILIDFNTTKTKAAQCKRCGPDVSVEITQPWKEGLVSLDEAGKGYCEMEPHRESKQFPRQTAI